MRIVRAAKDPIDIPQENRGGNCFVVALHEFMKSPRDSKLVHGVVVGQGAIDGIEYTHAWVERGDEVIDRTMPSEYQHMEKFVYYAIGQVFNEIKYDASEVSAMLEKYGTYGPWDSRFDNYY